MAEGLLLKGTVPRELARFGIPLNVPPEADMMRDRKETATWK